MTDILRKQHLAYYNKLGVQTKANVYNLVANYCKDNNIKIPENNSIIEFLDKNNLWYLMYYNSYD